MARDKLRIQVARTQLDLDPILNQRPKSQITNKVVLCPQEVATMLTPSGEEVKVIVTYDLGCDSELANVKAMKDLAEQKSVVPCDLATASDMFELLGTQGTIHLRKMDGSMHAKHFVSVEGKKGSVLEQNELMQVQVAPEIQKMVPKDFRQGIFEHHVVFGASALAFHPRTVLWSSEDHNSLALLSELTGQPILVGSFNQTKGPADRSDEKGYVKEEDCDDDEQLAESNAIFQLHDASGTDEAFQSADSGERTHDVGGAASDSNETCRTTPWLTGDDRDGSLQGLKDNSVEGVFRHWLRGEIAKGVHAELAEKGT